MYLELDTLLVVVAEVHMVELLEQVAQGAVVMGLLEQDLLATELLILAVAEVVVEETEVLLAHLEMVVLA
jgi:hypothetical protein